MRKLIVKVLLMLLITNFSFTVELSKYVMRAPVTQKAVCSSSTCKDVHAVSYNAVNFSPTVYKMNISCFKLNLKLPGIVPGSDTEGLSILLLILTFVLSPTLSTFFSLCRQRQLKHLIRREFKYRSHTHQSPEECSYQ